MELNTPRNKREVIDEADRDYMFGAEEAWRRDGKYFVGAQVYFQFVDFQEDECTQVGQYGQDVRFR